MQTIETRYLGATNYRGSRMVATASGAETRVTIPYDSGVDDADCHKQAALALCAKLNWEGKMIGGHGKDGMILGV